MSGLARNDGNQALTHITGLVLLLDDVLYDRQEWLIPALCFAAERLGMDPDRVALCVDNYVQQHGRADAGIYNHILLSFGQSDSVMNIRAFSAWVNRYEPLPGSLYMYAGVREALESLRYSHELCLLVQGNAESQKAVLSALDARKLFSNIVYADEIEGLRSRLPDDRALKGLLKSMISRQGNVMFVGNNPQKHFEVPNRLACTTVRCMTGEYSHLDNESGSGCARYCITSAARLPWLLGVADSGSGLSQSFGFEKNSDQIQRQAHA
ncbi:HAD hydrolase-like protein [bacterium]|nr:HAD hydrolase-like protein [bacterium]